MNKRKIKYRVVYAIKNLMTDKFYIGSAENYWNRMWTHIPHLNAGIHHSFYLQRSWNKYGKAAFVFGVIEELSEIDDIAPKEQYWMDYYDSYNSGYNIYPNARTALGNKHSDLTKMKQSLAKRGKSWTDAQRKAMKMADRSNHNMKGKTGKNHFKSKAIVRYDLLGNTIDEWESIRVCANSTGLHHSNIIECLKGRINQIEGFVFKYKAA